jgi:hypothetical protein
LEIDALSISLVRINLMTIVKTTLASGIIEVKEIWFGGNLRKFGKSDVIMDFLVGFLWELFASFFLPYKTGHGRCNSVQSVGTVVRMGKPRKPHDVHAIETYLSTKKYPGNFQRSSEAIIAAFC